MCILNQCFFLLAYISLYHIWSTQTEKERIKKNWKSESRNKRHIYLDFPQKKSPNKLYSLILFSYIIIILYKIPKDWPIISMSAASIFVCWFLAWFVFFSRIAMSPWLWVSNNETKLYSSGHKFDHQKEFSCIPFISVQLFY